MKMVKNEVFSDYLKETEIKPHLFLTVEKLFLFLVSLVFLTIAGVLVGGLVFLIEILFFPKSNSVNYFVAPLFAFVLFFVPLVTVQFIECLNFRKNYRILLTSGCIFTKRGTIWPQYDVIPYENIQDVQLNEGFFERITNTATVKISTPASETTIPLAKLNLAKKLREDILSKTEKKRLVD